MFQSSIMNVGTLNLQFTFVMTGKIKSCVHMKYYINILHGYTKYYKD